MRLFSKFIFISNISFIIAVIMRFVSFQEHQAMSSTDAVGFQPLKSTLIILGYGAILFNLIFLIVILIQKLLQKPQVVPLWIILASFFFFVIQVIYFFS